MTGRQEITSRIALGSVQFGLPYGVANATGRIAPTEGLAIIALARSAGIDTVDTAIAYGDSEAALGELGVSEWRVITKLPEMPVSGDAVADWVRSQLDNSLKRLGIESVHGLLLHRPAQLLGPDGKALYRALMAERERGRVGKIGISVYGPEELDQMLPSMKLDIVQAPLNILDNRIARSGWVARLQDAGCELHVRSIFLQGLLLMQRTARPAYFARWNPLWREWEDWLKDTGLSPLEACVRYALHASDIDKVVVGVDSVDHLAGILAAAEGEIPPLPANLLTDDTTLLNPALWNRS
jgi:aryl-alcohol dehydrogenase-like predicted oxidoreductase